ncbi:unnamed protein product, partial [Laminaria digitata]
MELLNDNQVVLNSLAQALLNLDGEAFLKCKKCDASENLTKPLDGNGVYNIQGLADINSYRRCVLGE